MDEPSLQGSHGSLPPLLPFHSFMPSALTLRHTLAHSHCQDPPFNRPVVRRGGTSCLMKTEETYPIWSLTLRGAQTSIRFLWKRTAVNKTKKHHYQTTIADVRGWLGCGRVQGPSTMNTCRRSKECAQSSEGHVHTGMAWSPWITTPPYESPHTHVVSEKQNMSHNQRAHSCN